MILKMWGERLAPAVMREVSFVRDDVEIALRIYRPVTLAGDARIPVTFCFHGGGFIVGSVVSVDPWARELCAGTDSCVISVGYRKAPESPFPIPVEDCYAAVRWAAQNGDGLMIDPSRFAVAGVSAGGCLAAAVALMCRDRGGAALRFQYLEVPCLDATMSSPSYDELANGYQITRADMEDAWSRYTQSPDDRLHPYASPLLANDLTELAAAYILVSSHDPMRDDGLRYAKRLRMAGVTTTLAVAEGHLHGLTAARTLFEKEASAMQAPAFAAIRAALNATPSAK